MSSNDTSRCASHDQVSARIQKQGAGEGERRPTVARRERDNRATAEAIEPATRPDPHAPVVIDEQTPDFIARQARAAIEFLELACVPPKDTHPNRAKPDIAQRVFCDISDVSTRPSSTEPTELEASLLEASEAAFSADPEDAVPGQVHGGDGGWDGTVRHGGHGAAFVHAQ